MLSTSGLLRVVADPGQILARVRGVCKGGAPPSQAAGPADRHRRDERCAHLELDLGTRSERDVARVFDELRQERAIACTTVMSTMDNLHRKGWLA
ncbi:MAG: hypothetical protein ACRDOK_13310 [Streptosporangiaceae bacterium]